MFSFNSRLYDTRLLGQHTRTDSLSACGTWSHRMNENITRSMYSSIFHRCACTGLKFFQCVFAEKPPQQACLLSVPFFFFFACYKGATLKLVHWSVGHFWVRDLRQEPLWTTVHQLHQWEAAAALQQVSVLLPLLRVCLGGEGGRGVRRGCCWSFLCLCFVCFLVWWYFGFGLWRRGFVMPSFFVASERWWPALSCQECLLDKINLFFSCPTHVHSERRESLWWCFYFLFIVSRHRRLLNGGVIHGLGWGIFTAPGILTVVGFFRSCAYQ